MMRYNEIELCFKIELLYQQANLFFLDVCMSYKHIHRHRKRMQ